MLTKFDSKSNRVKGLSFHPKRPWVLASLHNGVIQLWDYRIGTLLDRYEEHEGPVRGIDFHRSQPLFVSGGDDYKIKVWNYKLRRCLFTLLGHLDYIRTVQFHHEYPWIVSASDDQTIRLWNWQSRTCISVLTGHNHYVMCAQFHPREDLIVSASLDQTVRVWDTSGLRRKTVRGAMSDAEGVGRSGQDIFGAQDAVVKYVLEGHDRGCNWASFHPTQNLIVSGADDRLIKLWRMSDTKAWEMDTLRGHNNNVSCVLFHPRHDLVISNSEDRSIRVWDIQRRVCLSVFRREADRFWMLGLHAEQNLVAAGHDSGMVVFKLERERPAYASALGSLFYIKDRYLRRAVLGTGSDVPLFALRGRAPGLGQAPRTLYVNSFNPAGDEFLVISAVDGGMWELYTSAGSGGEGEPGKGAGITALFTARNKFAVLDKATRHITVRGMSANDAGKRIKPPYANADMMFPSSTTGRVLVRCDDRVCLFELSSRKVIAEIAGVSVKYVVWNSDGSMVALLGKHAIVLADRDLTQLSTVSETVRVKSGAWDEHGVFIYTTINHVKYLLPLTVTPAQSSTGSTSTPRMATAEGKEEEGGAAKAAASSSSPPPPTLTISGIVRTLDVPAYAVEAKGSSLYVLDRDAKCKPLPIDATEHTFKLALARRQFERVLNIIKGARLCGNAVLSFLQKAGYPEIALLFVEDDATKFHLALQCGNLDIATKAAKAMTAAGNASAGDAWSKLAVEAVKAGATEVAELAYQNTSSMEKLSFLYAVTGQRDKLGKMLLVAQARNDAQARFHNALLVGDASERVKVLEGAGQTALAYLTAATHGMEEDAGRLKGYLEQAGLPVPDVPAHARPLCPAVPVKAITGTFVRASAPPKRVGLDLAAIAALAAETANADQSTGDRASAAAGAAMEAARAAAAQEEEERRRAAAEAAAAESGDGEEGAEEGGGGWGDDLDLDEGVGGGKGRKASGGGGWGEEDDLGLDDAAEALDATQKAKADAAVKVAAAEAAGAVLPSAGSSLPTAWVSSSSLAADHVAAGSFESAMSTLNRQIGIVNFSPMKSVFLSVYSGARGSLPTLPGLPSMPHYYARPEEGGGVPTRDRSMPAVIVTLSVLTERIQRVQACFTDGKFTEARDVLDGLFATLPLAVARSKEEVDAIKGVLRAATEYKMAVRIMQTAKAHDAADGVRQIELAAYMTHCALEPPHLVLALNLAMSMAYKHQNFIHAAGFARRLLELPEANSAKNATLATKAKKVLQLSEAQARNALKLDYDERTPFSLCAATLTPLYKGQGEVVRAPYSGASYKPEFRGKVCVLDGMSSVGTETLGLVVASAAVAGTAPGGDRPSAYGRGR